MKHFRGLKSGLFFGFGIDSLRALIFLGILANLTSCNNDETARSHIMKKNNESESQALALTNSTLSPPFVSLSPTEVCSGVTFLNVQGDTVVGTRLCGTGSVSNCTLDGQENCSTTATFKAASSSALASTNIKIDITLGGVAGSVGVPDCNADNQTNCHATTSFKAFNSSAFLSANYLNTVTLGGMQGTLLPPPAPCTANGSQACLVQGTYYSGLACSEGLSACYVPTYAAGSQPRKAINFTHINSNLSKLRSGQIVAGVSGTLPDCISSGSSNCFALNASFRAVDSSLLVSANIRSPVNIGGETGGFPSATYPLTGASATADLDSATFSAKIKSDSDFEYWDSQGNKYTGAGSSLLTPTNILSAIDIFGATGSMTIAPPPDHVRFGTAINPGIGNLKTSCRNSVNTGVYDIDLSLQAIVVVADNALNTFTSLSHGLSPNDPVILLGGSAPGALSIGNKYYVTNPTLNNFLLASTSSGTAIDFTSNGSSLKVVRVNPNSTPDSWDSLDDLVATLSPSHLPPNSEERCNGPAGSVDSVFVDVTQGPSAGMASSCGTTAANCTLIDRSSGLWWSKSSASSMNFAGAASHCNGLSHNFVGDWRLPTQKELQGLSIHGIVSGTHVNHIVSNFNHWSATRNLTNTSYIHVVNFSTGLSTTVADNTMHRVACVREAP